MGVVLWTTLAAVGLPGPASADAGCPAGEPCVVVRDQASNQSYVVDPALLDQIGDVSTAQYTTYTGRGGVHDDPYVAKGASIAAILAHFALTATRVTAQSGPNAYLTQLDQTELGTGYQGGLTPVFYSDSPQFIRFVRPMRDGTDANYRDNWSGQSNSAVYLDVYTSGRVLHPVIKASTTSTKAGTAVTFSAGFQGYQPSGATYAWNFGDGKASTVPAPSHAWAEGGSAFSVNLTVQGAGDAAGTATPVVVRVGAAPRKKATHHKAGTGSGGSHQPVTGSSSGTGHSSGSASSTSGTSSTATPTPSPAPSAAPSPSASPKPTPKPKQPVAVAAGERVEGVLLVADRSQSGSSSAEQSTTPRPAAAARADGSRPWDRRVLWVLMVPAVMLAGAAAQSRWLARRLPVPAWRKV